jgi:DNA-binding transcriptional regulator YhcF (GntR family)
MKIWLSKNSEVSLHEQLTRQIMTAIASGDVQSGDKLPSVRELALRLKIHQNTVSAAYRWLEANGWVASHQGSGVFVREVGEAVSFESENILDIIIANFFRHARQLGFTDLQIKTGVGNYSANPQPERILVVEKDEYLRRIIFTELQSSLDYPIFAVAPEEIAVNENVIVAAMPETAKDLREILPSNSFICSLKINSAQVGITGQQKPNADDLIGITSGWEMFLRWAKTFLLAVGIEAERIVVRDAREKNFQKGLESCAFVVTDSATAQILPKSLEKRIFRLIADDSIEELKELFG